MAKEAELTQEVPTVLDNMNRAAGEVNTFERKATECQARYRQLLDRWSRAYEELRSQHGSAIDRVKPFFDAAQALNAAAHRVEAMTREFSAANSLQSQAKEELRSIEMDLAFGAHKVRLDGSQQDRLSKATVRVVRCTEDRDRREQEYARALKEYKEAQELCDSLRKEIGTVLIKRFGDCFRQLQHHQDLLAVEQQRINHFVERAHASKATYKHCMRELERINDAVHDARRKSKKAAEAKPEAAPEESPEATPELSPEAMCRIIRAKSEDLASEPFDTAPVVELRAERGLIELPVKSTRAAADQEDQCPFT